MARNPKRRPESVKRADTLRRAGKGPRAKQTEGDKESRAKYAEGYDEIDWSKKDEQ
tara:strand:+ start:823 stop:990 length:168 start_codon:yes stop_codon:yes gene_type:complete